MEYYYFPYPKFSCQNCQFVLFLIVLLAQQRTQPFVHVFADNNLYSEYYQIKNRNSVLKEDYNHIVFDFFHLDIPKDENHLKTEKNNSLLNLDNVLRQSFQQTVMSLLNQLNHLLQFFNINLCFYRLKELRVNSSLMIKISHLHRQV